MTIFGFPLYTFMHAYGIPLIILVFIVRDAIRGNYEGKKVEENSAWMTGTEPSDAPPRENAQSITYSPEK